MHLLEQQDASELSNIWHWQRGECKVLTGTEARKWQPTYGHLHVLRSVML